MKYSRKILGIIISFVIVFNTFDSQAGNEQRAGQSGAAQLLINPWARSNGYGTAGSAFVKGIEAQYSNVAGTAFTKKTEILFARSELYGGSGISINSFGISQKTGEYGVLGLSIMSMSFGEIERTTVDMPEGGLGTFTPQYLNIILSYAKEFSNSIYGGFAIKIVNEGISDASANGIAVDAGIQYVASERLRLGIALKNVGPTMKYSGDGLSFRGYNGDDNYKMTVMHRTEKFELPSLIRIGLAYDAYSVENHRVTALGTFTSNAFSNDLYSLGAEYGLYEKFLFRAGYTMERNMYKDDESMSIYSGLSGGLSVVLPFKKDSESKFELDYSYCATKVLNGVHTFGVRVDL